MSITQTIPHYPANDDCPDCAHVERHFFWRGFLRGFGSLLSFGLQARRDVGRELDEIWAEHEHHRITRERNSL